jgi:hypothetical protein
MQVTAQGLAVGVTVGVGEGEDVGMAVGMGVGPTTIGYRASTVDHAPLRLVHSFTQSVPLVGRPLIAWLVAVPTVALNLSAQLAVTPAWRK